MAGDSMARGGRASGRSAVVRVLGQRHLDLVIGDRRGPRRIDRSEELLDTLFGRGLHRSLVALDDHRPEIGRLEFLRERIGVADEDQRDPLEVDVLAGDPLDVGDRDGVDPLAIASQLVVRQLVDKQAGQRTEDRARRLESDREDPDEVVPGGAQLLVRDAVVPNAVAAPTSRRRSRAP